MSMITATQLRMAKAALKWSNADLSAKAGVHKNTISRAETGYSTRATMALLQQTLEVEGIEFVGDNGVLISADLHRRISEGASDSS